MPRIFQSEGTVSTKMDLNDRKKVRSKRIKEAKSVETKSNSNRHVLRAGMRIRYYNPLKLISLDALCYATIVEVLPISKRGNGMAPFVMDTYMALPWIHQIAVVEPYQTKFIGCEQFEYEVSKLSSKEIEALKQRTEQRVQAVAEKARDDALEQLDYEVRQTDMYVWDKEHDSSDSESIKLLVSSSDSDNELGELGATGKETRLMSSAATSFDFVGEHENPSLSGPNDQQSAAMSNKDDDGSKIQRRSSKDSPKVSRKKLILTSSSVQSRSAAPTSSSLNSAFTTFLDNISSDDDIDESDHEPIINDHQLIPGFVRTENTHVIKKPTKSRVTLGDRKAVAFRKTKSPSSRKGKALKVSSASSHKRKAAVLLEGNNVSHSKVVVRYRPKPFLALSSGCSFQQQVFTVSRPETLQKFWVTAWKEQELAIATAVKPMVSSSECFDENKISTENIEPLDWSFNKKNNDGFKLSTLLDEMKVVAEECALFVLKSTENLQRSHEFTQLTKDVITSYFASEPLRPLSSPIVPVLPLQPDILEPFDAWGSFDDDVFAISDEAVAAEERDLLNATISWHQEEEEFANLKKTDLSVPTSNAKEVTDNALVFYDNLFDGHLTQVFSSFKDLLSNRVDYFDILNIPTAITQPLTKWMSPDECWAMLLCQDVRQVDEEKHRLLPKLELPFMTSDPLHVPVVKEKKKSISYEFPALLDPCDVRGSACHVADATDVDAVSLWASKFTMAMEDGDFDHNIMLRQHDESTDLHAIGSDDLVVAYNAAHISRFAQLAHEHIARFADDDMLKCGPEAQLPGSHLSELVLPMFTTSGFDNPDDAKYVDFSVASLSIDPLDVDITNISTLLVSRRADEVHAEFMAAQAFMDDRTPSELELPTEKLFTLNEKTKIGALCNEICDELSRFDDVELSFTPFSSSLDTAYQFAGLSPEPVYNAHGKVVTLSPPHQSTIVRLLDPLFAVETVTVPRLKSGSSPLKNYVRVSDDTQSDSTSAAPFKLNLETVDANDALEQYIRLHAGNSTGESTSHLSASMRVHDRISVIKVQPSLCLQEFSEWIHSISLPAWELYSQSANEQEGESEFVFLRSIPLAILTPESVVFANNVRDKQQNPENVKARFLAAFVLYASSHVLKLVYNSSIFAAYYFFRALQSSSDYAKLFDATRGDDNLSFLNAILRQLSNMLDKMMTMDEFDHSKYGSLKTALGTDDVPYEVSDDEGIPLVLVQQRCTLLQLALQITDERCAILEDVVHDNAAQLKRVLVSAKFAFAVRNDVFAAAHFPWERVSKLVMFDTSLECFDELQDSGLHPIEEEMWVRLVKVPSIIVFTIAPSSSLTTIVPPLPSEVIVLVSERIEDNFPIVQNILKKHHVVCYSRPMPFVDVILDEQSCIVFLPVAEMIRDRSFQARREAMTELTQNLSAIEQSYQHCFLIIIAANDEELGCREFPDVFGLLQYVLMMPNMNIYYDFATSDEMIAAAVVSAIVQCSETNETWQCNFEQWSNRKWLQLETSPVENFLSAFPMLNYMSAQMILHGVKVDLRSFLQWSLDERLERTAFLGDDINHNLHTLINADFGVKACRVMIESCDEVVPLTPVQKRTVSSVPACSPDTSFHVVAPAHADLTLDEELVASVPHYDLTEHEKQPDSVRLSVFDKYRYETSPQRANVMSPHDMKHDTNLYSMPNDSQYVEPQYFPPAQPYAAPAALVASDSGFRASAQREQQRPPLQRYQPSAKRPSYQPEVTMSLPSSMDYGQQSRSLDHPNHNFQGALPSTNDFLGSTPTMPTLRRATQDVRAILQENNLLKHTVAYQQPKHKTYARHMDFKASTTSPGRKRVSLLPKHRRGYGSSFLDALK